MGILEKTTKRTENTKKQPNTFRHCLFDERKELTLKYSYVREEKS